MDPTNTTPTLASRITLRRTKQGLSLSGLARKAMLDLRYVRRIETGQRTPSLATVAVLAKALDCSVDHLVNGGAVGDVPPGRHFRLARLGDIPMADLAADCGLPQRTVENACYGKSASLPVVIKVTRAAGVTIDECLYRKN